MNSTKARPNLQLLLQIVRAAQADASLSLYDKLDPLARYMALIALIGRLKLVPRPELRHWVWCADGPARPSPVECPAWGAFWDAQDEDEELEEVLGLFEACTNEACDHTTDIAELREHLAERSRWWAEIEKSRAEASGKGEGTP